MFAEALQVNILPFPLMDGLVETEENQSVKPDNMYIGKLRSEYSMSYFRI